MIRLFCIIILSVFTLSNLFAVKATPNLLQHKQSDGSILNYYIHGDEYFSYRTTTDGYLIAPTYNGDMVYASFLFDEIQPSNIIAYNLDLRSQNQINFLSQAHSNNIAHLTSTFKLHQQALKAIAQESFPKMRYPKMGSPKSLVILVNFDDVAFVMPNPQQAFSRLLNEKGYSENGGTGSAKDYFEGSSFNQFSPNFVVVGPYTLPKKMEYYGGNRGGSDANPRQMIVDACILANPDVNFKDYDTDNDGKVDNVFVYYAGHNEAEGASSNTIWPHRSVVWGANIDGVEIYDYACTSELRAHTGSSMCGIGTFAHEFGHVIGLPDFYVTYGQGYHTTLEQWDIMDAGSYNNEGRTPPSYSSYERFYLGWLTPDTIYEGSHVLEPLITSNKAYIVSNGKHNLNGADPNPLEFFMVENRQPIGWDEKALPGKGMLVEHVVYNEYTWESNTPNNDPDNMGVTILRADASNNNLGGDTYPGNKKVTSCAFKSRDKGIVWGRMINIQEDGNNITFTYGNPGPNEPFIENVNNLENFVAFKNDTADIQVLTIMGRKLASPVVFSVKSYDANFRLRLKDSGEKFSTSLTINPNADSTILCDIEILCVPREMTYSSVLSTPLSIECKEFVYAYALMWQAPRPVYIVPPVANDATEITPYSLIANWDKVDDATAYYIYLYDENNELVDTAMSFDNKYKFPKLLPSNDYYYNVRATDCDFTYDRYNNVTGLSNSVNVKTLSGYAPEDNKLTIKRMPDGSYVCYMTEYFYTDDKNLYIYNLSGNLVAEIKVNSIAVTIPSLSPGNIYVVKLIENGVFDRKSKVAKFYYDR